MNNATELESSIDEALGFFQNLRRSLGTLEAEASAQHDRLRAVAASVATLQQDWQADHQSLANLTSDSSTQAGQLAELRTDNHRLDTQLNTVENLIAGIQQDQQHLRQNLTTLTTELHAQQADLRQDWQSLVEQQAGPLARIEALEQQLSTQVVELSNLQTSLQGLSQDARTVQNSVTALESQIGQHNSQLGQLEHTVHSGQERLEQIGTRAENQDQHLHRLENALGTLNQTTETSAETLREQLQNLQVSIQTLNQDARTIQGGVATLESQIGQHHNQLKQLEQTVNTDQKRLEQIDTRTEDQDQHLHQIDSALSTLNQTTATSAETLREQIEEQRAQFDDLTGSLATIWQDAQTLQEEVTRISSEFEIRSRTFADGTQTRQDLQKQQERLKHLETLMGKVSADTNSTRQILNVLQTDLTNQSDLLRELDQNWRDTLITHQDRSGPAESPVGEPSSPSSTHAPISELEDHLAASRQAYASLQQEISVVQGTLTGQGERLSEIQNTLQEQLQTQQERLGQIEAALANTQGAPSPETVPVNIQPAFASDSGVATADLAALHETLTAQIGALNELREVTQQQSHAQQERLSQLEAALAAIQQAPAPDAVATADPTTLNEALAVQIGALSELRETTQQQLQTQQERLSQLEAALAAIQQTPAPDAAAVADLSTLHETLAAQAGALNDLREISQQRFSAFENQKLDFQHAANSIGDLHQETQDLQQQLTRLVSVITQQQSAGSDLQPQELHQDLEMLQQAMVELESRMASQTQTVNSNTEKFRDLRAEIHNLQQNFAALDVLPEQLQTLYQNLNSQERQVTQIKQTVQQLQQDSQQLSIELQSHHDEGSSIAALETRMAEQRDQMDNLTATIETIQSDARINQEKVVTMATNVAKRIFEFQDKLTISETVQTERLQEAEQKIIQLQAALEILQTTLKGRSWFKMPATFTTIMLTVGTAFLGILAKVIWTIS